MAAVVERQYEGEMELVMFQWLGADVVQVESRASSQGDTHKHNTVPPPLHALGPLNFIISLSLQETYGKVGHNIVILMRERRQLLTR